VQPAVELSWRDPERLVPAFDTPSSAATAAAASALRGTMRGFEGAQSAATLPTEQRGAHAAANGDVEMACEEELSLGGALVRPHLRIVLLLSVADCGQCSLYCDGLLCFDS
jgi:hypothetical protein